MSQHDLLEQFIRRRHHAAVSRIELHGAPPIHNQSDIFDKLAIAQFHG